MAKEDYTETKREDVIGDEIPVAQTNDDLANSLLPKKEEGDELIVKYRKPYTFEGEVHNELDLHGLEDLTGRDLTAIEKSFNKTGVSSFVPESTTTFAKIVATRVTGLPAEYFEDLPAGEVEKIKNAVVGFLYKDE
jgi:hypothetical protein